MAGPRHGVRANAALGSRARRVACGSLPSPLPWPCHHEPRDLGIKPALIEISCLDVSAVILKSEALSKSLESLFYNSAYSGFPTLSAPVFFSTKCGKRVCGKECQQRL